MKVINFRYLIKYLFIFVFLILVSSDQKSFSQDFPFVLEKKSDMSPRNRETYDAAVEAYKKAICFDQGQINCTPNETRAIEARDRLVYMAIGHIDLNFTQYQKRSRRGRAIFETLLDFLSFGAKAAIVITNGERAKSIIGESLGFLQLSRESAEKNFKLKEAQILFNQMEAKRSEVLLRILTRLQGDPAKSIPKSGIGVYPFEAAWIDIVQYYRAGTLDDALTALSADSGAKKLEADENLENFQFQKFVTPEVRATSQTIQEKLVAIETDVRKPADSDENKNVTKRLQRIYLALRQNRKFGTILDQLRGEAATLTPAQIGTDERKQRFKNTFDSLNRQSIDNTDALTLYRVLGYVFERAEALDSLQDLEKVLEETK